MPTLLRWHITVADGAAKYGDQDAWVSSRYLLALGRGTFYVAGPRPLAAGPLGDPGHRGVSVPSRPRRPVTVAAKQRNQVREIFPQCPGCGVGWVVGYGGVGFFVLQVAHASTSSS